MGLSRQERRALQRLYGPATPWKYEKELARRRREAALIKAATVFCSEFNLDLESVLKAVLSVNPGPAMEL